MTQWWGLMGLGAPKRQGARQSGWKPLQRVRSWLRRAATATGRTGTG